MQTLITNTKYGKILESRYMLDEIDYKQYFIFRNNFDNFLTQVLELWMFIPCKLVDDVWQIMEVAGSAAIYTHSEKYLKEYQEAKDRVLFQGFSQGIYPLEKHIMHEKGWGIDMMNLGKIKIEEYANERYNLELTPTAQR